MQVRAYLSHFGSLTVKAICNTGGQAKLHYACSSAKMDA
jgi:hypothetical protein